MGMNLEGFDALKVEPAGEGYEALPAGSYQAVIVHSEQKTTNKGDGEYLKLQIKIEGPTHAGRVVFDNLNLKNRSEKAVTIAKATLSSICRAVNVLSPKDSSDLHGRTLTVRIGCREYNGQIQNEVKGYGPADAGGHMIAEAFAAPAQEKPASPW
jgi:hypothetical protein